MADTVIKIDSGVKTVSVQMDDNAPHEISFNPNDALFATKLHKLYFDAKNKIIELNDLEKVEPELDENKMPISIDEQMSQVHEINQWFKDQIDALFGEGTSKKIYGDNVYTGERVDVYLQLLGGIAENVEPVRQEKTKKYVKK